VCILSLFLDFVLKINIVIVEKTLFLYKNPLIPSPPKERARVRLL